MKKTSKIVICKNSACRNKSIFFLKINMHSIEIAFLRGKMARIEVALTYHVNH
jgi:hypothetical protein